MQTFLSFLKSTAQYPFHEGFCDTLGGGNTLALSAAPAISSGSTRQKRKSAHSDRSTLAIPRSAVDTLNPVTGVATTGSNLTGPSSGNFFALAPNPLPVPELSTWSMIAAGGVALLAMMLRKKRRGYGKLPGLSFHGPCLSFLT